jgi:hypothetical protein
LARANKPPAVFVATIVRQSGKERVEVWRSQTDKQEWAEAFTDFARRLDATVQPVLRRTMKGENADAGAN